MMRWPSVALADTSPCPSSSPARRSKGTTCPSSTHRMRWSGRTQAMPDVPPQRMDFGQGKPRMIAGMAAATREAASTVSAGFAEHPELAFLRQRLPRRAMLAQEALDRLVGRADARAALLLARDADGCAQGGGQRRCAVVRRRSAAAPPAARRSVRRTGARDPPPRAVACARGFPRRTVRAAIRALGRSLHVGAGDILAPERQRVAAKGPPLATAAARRAEVAGRDARHRGLRFGRQGAAPAPRRATPGDHRRPGQRRHRGRSGTTGDGTRAAHQDTLTRRPRRPARPRSSPSPAPARGRYRRRARSR